VRYHGQRALLTFREGQKKSSELRADWLYLNQVYYAIDRMDKRTRGKKAAPTSASATARFRSRAECKKLSPDQEIQAE
jgi:hypothetical protein